MLHYIIISRRNCVKHNKILQAAAAGMALALALSACASPASSTAPAASATTQAAKASATTAAKATTSANAAASADSSINAKLNGYNGTDKKDPITFTFWNFDMTKDNPYTDAVAQQIQKLTGVT